MFPFVKVMAASWIVFWLYWLVSAFGSKRNTKPNIKQFAVIRLGLIALALVLASIFDRQPFSFQNRVATKNELVLMIGLVIFAAGLALAVWARRYLGKNWGMPMTQKQEPELVTSGPYQYIRHPIYSGILLAALGSALDINIYWLLVLIIFAVYFTYSAVVEERLMTKQFPKVYPAYKLRTKMLIPFVF